MQPRKNPKNFDKGFYWHFSKDSPAGYKKWPGSDGLTQEMREEMGFPNIIFADFLLLDKVIVIKANAWVYRNRDRLPEDIKNTNFSRLYLVIRANAAYNLLSWSLFSNKKGPQIGGGRVRNCAGFWQTSLAKLAFQGFGVYPAIISVLKQLVGPLRSSQTLSIGAEKAWQRAGGIFGKKQYAVNPLRYRDYLEDSIEYEDGDFNEYYPKSAAGTYVPEREESLYLGSNVIWDGIEGHMVRVPADNVVWDPQNILDSNKLASVVKGIQEGENIILQAAWGSLSKVCLQTIKESIEYAEDDEYGILTTGDEELDEFLVNPGDVVTNYYDSEDPESFCEKYKEFMDALREAEQNDMGDLGQWIFTPVDGHHRIWGAILAGEPYVWVMLSGNQLQDALQGESAEDKEIAEMLE